MCRALNSIVKLSVLALAVVCIAAFADSASAQPEPCNVTIFKLAEGGEDTVFFVDGFINDVLVFNGDLLGNGFVSISQFIPLGSLFEAVELPTPGWEFTGVICETVNGMTTTETDSGFTATCDVPGGTATCTLLNVRVLPENIPTLSEWGMIAAAGGLMMVGVWFAVRRRRAVGV